MEERTGQTWEHIRGKGNHEPGLLRHSQRLGGRKAVAGTSSAHLPRQQAGSVCEARGERIGLSDRTFSTMCPSRDVHRQHLLLSLGFRSTHWPEIIVFLFTLEKQFVACL